MECLQSINYDELRLKNSPHDDRWIDGLRYAKQLMNLFESENPNLEEAKQLRDYLKEEWVRHPSWFNLRGIASTLVEIIEKKQKDSD